jgi:hypothetical protein
MAARKPKPPLKVVGRLGTPDSVVMSLNAALERAENDETLAIALVEIQREGEAVWTWTSAHNDQLIASTHRLLRDLLESGDE